MKGPSQRLKFELRRTWECPVCQRRERAAGSVTSRLCMCQTKQAEGKPVVMRLAEDGVRRVTLPAATKQQAAVPATVEAMETASTPIAEPILETPAIDPTNSPE